MVFYYVTKAVVPGSLLERFIDGDDEFRNSRFKLIPSVPKVVSRLCPAYIVSHRQLYPSFDTMTNFRRMHYHRDHGSYAKVLEVLRVYWGKRSTATIYVVQNTSK